MAQRLLRTSVLIMLTTALLLGGGSAGTDFVHADPSASIVDLSESSPNQASQQFELRSTIAFTSNRHNPTGAGLPGSNPRDRLLNSGEIYLMDGDGANQRRVTNNVSGDGFPTLSPDGKKILFDSNRLGHVTPPACESTFPTCTHADNWDLFVMNGDGSDQQHLTRGASSTWAPDGKHIAYHASATGTKGPITTSVSSATSDSDIFVLNVDDCRKAIEQSLPRVDDCRKIPGEHWKNITNSLAIIEDDPDWSPVVLPNGKQKIVFTGHPVGDPPGNAPNAEIYVLTVNPNGMPVQDGTENPRRLTFDTEEQRAPSWSPDGTRIAFNCRNPSNMRFEVCVMNADGTNQVRLTDNDLVDSSATWSPDGTRIVFNRGTGTAAFQLWSMNANGTDQKQLTPPVGSNLPPHASLNGNWGVLRVPGGASTVTQPARAPAAAPVPKR